MGETPDNLPIHWRPIETAPKDGTHFLGYSDEDVYAWSHIKETWMSKYTEGSVGYEKYLSGEIPRNIGWMYVERNTCFYWKPTHWMPMPASPMKSEVTP